MCIYVRVCLCVLCVRVSTVCTRVVSVFVFTCVYDYVGVSTCTYMCVFGPTYTCDRVSVSVGVTRRGTAVCGGKKRWKREGGRGKGPMTILETLSSSRWRKPFGARHAPPGRLRE